MEHLILRVRELFSPISPELSLSLGGIPPKSGTDTSVEVVSIL
jgi:hypothetical protein